MIPYWHFPTYSLGPLTLQTWGTFVSLGVLVALLITRRKARRLGLNQQSILDTAFWIILLALVGARLGHVFFYEWYYFRDHLGEIWKIWQGGYSSLGGFLGASLAFLWRTRLVESRREWLMTADTLISGFPLGWTIGRIGCFLIHDHPGTLTSFVLGVQYPDGTRHDLGLEDGLNTLGLAILLFFLSPRLEKKPGLTLVLISIWYSGARFFLDFLRAYDARYLGLTPAQFGSIILISAMILWFAPRLSAIFTSREPSS